MNDERVAALRTIFKFYEALGFERLPVNISDESALVLREENTGYGSYETRVKGDESLQVLIDEIGICTRCKLSSGGRTTIVFGEGDPGAELMFIGEGPGKEEDLQGRPFVGDAGKLLTRLIGKMGFKRSEVYIANIVKCRPPMNRDPEDEEIAACIPFLREQIKAVSPSVIMTLGRIAVQALLGIKTPISRLRGKFLDYDGIPLMPTFHPAYLLRNPKDKMLVWSDAQNVLSRLGRKAP